MLFASFGRPWASGEGVTPPYDAVGGEGFKKQVTQFGQNGVFENIPSVTDGPGRLFSGDLFEIVAYSVGNAVGATARHTYIGKSVAFGPTPDGLLGLPIVQDLYFVGFSGVVGKSKRIGFIGAVAKVAPTDPRSCC
jgi:hypothetical protein